MSKRNSAEAKRAARERLRAERERQAKREKIRRQLTVAGVVVVVLAAAGGIGVAVANMDSGDGGGDATDWGAVEAQVTGDGERTYPTEAPANTDGEDGLTVRVGDDEAENTLTLYEDPRCPACAAFEQTMGAEVKEGVENGDYAAEYVFGTFIDGMADGTGSKNALSALGAALNVSEDAFLAYHDELYSAEVHPSESSDEFGDDERLIEIAQAVPELRDNQQFERDVRDSTYAVWAFQMSQRFDDTPDVDSTPTLRWNDEIIDTPQTAEEFQQFVRSNS